MKHILNLLQQRPAMIALVVLFFAVSMIAYARLNHSVPEQSYEEVTLKQDQAEGQDGSEKSGVQEDADFAMPKGQLEAQDAANAGNADTASRAQDPEYASRSRTHAEAKRISNARSELASKEASDTENRYQEERGTDAIPVGYNERGRNASEGDGGLDFAGAGDRGDRNPIASTHRRYASPLAQGTKASHAIGIIVTELGLDTATVEYAHKVLPKSVAFALHAHSIVEPQRISRMQREGREFIMQIPMEPSNFPAVDAGYQSLLRNLNWLENKKRLHQHINRWPGYIAVMPYHGYAIVASDAIFFRVLSYLHDRQVAFVVPHHFPNESAIWDVKGLAMVRADFHAALGRSQQQIEALMKTAQNYLLGNKRVVISMAGDRRSIEFLENILREPNNKKMRAQLQFISRFFEQDGMYTSARKIGKKIDDFRAKQARRTANDSRVGAP